MAFAKVLFRKDNCCKCVPISFIEKFNPKDYDSKTRYWVFYSNSEDDTPQTLLERVEEIPHVEDSDESEEAGYYRATVSLVADSLEKLEEMATKKRVRNVSGKLLRDASFSEQKQNANKSVNRSSKRVTSSRKRQGGNQDHALSGKKVKQEDKNSTVGAAVETHRRRANELNLKRLAHNANNKDVSAERIKQKVQNVVESKQSRKKSHGNSSTTKDSSLTEVDDGDKFDSSSSGHSTENEDDPPFVDPKDFAALEFKVKALESNNKRYLNFNEKLQGNLLEVEEQVKDLLRMKHALEEENKSLTTQLADARRNIDALSSSSDAPGLQYPMDVPAGVIPKDASKQNAAKQLSIHDSQLHNSSEDISGKGDGAVAYPTAVPRLEITFPSEAALTHNASEQEVGSKHSNIHHTTHADVKDKGNQIAESGPLSDFNVDEVPVENQRTDNKTGEAGEESYCYCPGKSLSRDQWLELLRKYNGERGDSLFCKTMSMKIFTAPVLMASNVKGIKRKPKSDHENDSRPGLNKALFECLTKCVIDKLKAENVIDPATNKRSSEDTIKGYVRDKIKVLRRISSSKSSE